MTGTVNYQDVESDGYNDYDPSVGDLETIKFNKEYRTDEWIQTSLIIEGDLGFAQLVSATSYYDRDMFYSNDTQSYAAYFHYSFGIYYGYATYDFGLDPTGYLTNEQNNESFTQEFRLRATLIASIGLSARSGRSQKSSGISIRTKTAIATRQPLKPGVTTTPASHQLTCGGILIKAPTELTKRSSVKSTLKLSKIV